MEWNVFRYNMNLREIETYNIFNHGTFLEYVKKAAEKYKNKDEFVEQLKTELLYYFWRKAEWEVVIASWVGGDREDAKKIDAYSQVMANFEIFADYVWNNKEKLYEI
jgi:hypothetical protein